MYKQFIHYCKADVNQCKSNGNQTQCCDHL